MIWNYMQKSGQKMKVSPRYRKVRVQKRNSKASICCQTISPVKHYQDERNTPWKIKTQVTAEIGIIHLKFIWCCKQQGVARLIIIKSLFGFNFHKIQLHSFRRQNMKRLCLIEKLCTWETLMADILLCLLAKTLSSRNYQFYVCLCVCSSHYTFLDIQPKSRSQDANKLPQQCLFTD